jgi:uroporphyrin-3 C-methyltransferase
MEPNEEPEKKGTAKHRNALLVYVSVLFGVAFLLILLSFFIQLRNSNETISQLSQSSATAMTSVENLQNTNQALQNEKKELEAQLEDLEAQLEQAQADLADVQSQLDTQTAALTKEKEATQALSDELETETARADAQTTQVEALTEKARAYELLIQAENYFRSGYYSAAQEVLDTMEEENLAGLLDQQAKVLYSSLPDRIYLAQLPTTDSMD